jgi:hypothetical protein
MDLLIFTSSRFFIRVGLLRYPFMRAITIQQSDKRLYS